MNNLTVEELLEKAHEHRLAYALLYTSAVAFCCQEQIEDKLFAFLRKHNIPEPPKWEPEKWMEND